MFRLLLVRAGATEFDEDGRIVGQLDIPLSQEGREQAEQLAKSIVSDAGLPIQAIYVSKHQAALETADAVAKATGSKIVQWKQLLNLNHGLWQGKTVDAIKSQFPKVYRRWQEQPETVCPPEGEMLAAVRERLFEVLNKIDKRTRGGVIAVVVAEPLASILAALLKREELGDLWKSESNRCHWELIEIPEIPSSIAASA